MPENPDTFLEIDLEALAHNYRLIRSRLRPETRLMGVVKAFAYGSESLAISQKLESLGADYLAVAFTREGVRLRKLGIRLPIMVLHPQPENLEDNIAHCLEPCLYSRRILTHFLETAKETRQKDYPVHLKFNTGLNRLGFKLEDLGWISHHLKDQQSVSARSIFSHLAASDDLEESEFTRSQIRAFQKIVTEAEDLIPGELFKHLLNTSGVFNYPEAQWDMVRTGIGLYGYSNHPKSDALLKPVARLCTRISQIHQVVPGEWVGYNKGFKAMEPRTTATLPIGHADGIGRQYGRGTGYVFIGGNRAPIIGNVCMDMTMVDVTGLPCREGDQVVFFGGPHSAEDLAGKAGTISYELLAGISQRVPRIVLE